MQVEDGKIVRFATYMTGELFAVLCQHSILGRLMPEARKRQARAGRHGLRTGPQRGAAQPSPATVSHQIFATRTLGLTGRLPPAALADYLSGLLIGSELVSGLAGAREQEAFRWS